MLYCTNILIQKIALYLMEMLSDAISEQPYFKIVLGGMPPDPLAGVLHTICNK